MSDPTDGREKKAVRAREIDAHQAIARIVATRARAMVAEGGLGGRAGSGGRRRSRGLSLVAREKARANGRLLVEGSGIEGAKSKVVFVNGDDELGRVVRIRLKRHAGRQLEAHDSLDDVVARRERREVASRDGIRCRATVDEERLPDGRRRQEVAIEAELEDRIDGDAALELGHGAVEAGAVFGIGGDDAQGRPHGVFELAMAGVAAGQQAEGGSRQAQLSE